MLTCGLTAVACTKSQPDYRGAGLRVDSLPANDVAAVYRAALAGSFRLNDTSLYILVDPVLLPRESGLAGGDTLAPDVLTALRSNGLVKGTCKIPVRKTRVAVVCRADKAGYIVRFSPPFALGGDSAQVNVVVQEYTTPNGMMGERMRFERAYHVARQGSAWHALREARMPEP